MVRLVISSGKSGAFEIMGITIGDEVGENYLIHVQYDYEISVKLTIKNLIFSARGPHSPIFVGG